MRWRGNRSSNNVEDRRHVRASGGFSGGGRGAGGLIRLLPMVFRLLGFKGTAVAVVGLAAYGFFSGDLSRLLGGDVQTQSASQSTSVKLKQSPEEKQLVEFVSVVLADTEETWHALFKQRNETYKEPRLVLFRDAVTSACGLAQSATGPFYCPADQQIYIDLGFYDQLKHRFKAPGDFAQAYVIAHEVGHHIQTLDGTSRRVHAARKKLSQKESNKLSVLQELQADCLAGVWAHHANRSRQLLETGDLEEGLRAASAIGDDALQKQARGVVSPDSFTHGSSAQRVKWFKTGFAKGDIESCDTFSRTLEPVTDTLQNPRITKKSDQTVAFSNAHILQVFKQQQSDVQVEGYGIVSRVLADDNEGSRHQKFILKVADQLTVLIAHNIDLAPRIKGIKPGDRVDFYGEYEWSKRGGVVHWTHHDPGGRHIGGWLKHNNQVYQ